MCVCMYVYVCVSAYMYMYVCIIYWGNVIPKTEGGIVLHPRKLRNRGLVKEQSFDKRG